jgi:proteasome lid subunit RPN8/RPN11
MGFKDEDATERCGVVLEPRHGECFLVELPNAHDTPELSFAMRQSDVRIALMQHGGTKLRGVFHTHLRQEEYNPSPHDYSELNTLRQQHPELMGIVYVIPIALLVVYTPDGVERHIRVPRWPR